MLSEAREGKELVALMGLGWNTFVPWLREIRRSDLFLALDTNQASSAGKSEDQTK